MVSERCQEYQASTIDYIFAIIPTTGIDFLDDRVRDYMTIFDHTYLNAKFGQKIAVKPTTIKDYILGCPEYLISAEELI